MKNLFRNGCHTSVLIHLLLVLLQINYASAVSYPIEIIDSENKTIVIEKKPENVVSLVPSITEIMFTLVADEGLKGITYHDTYPSGTSEKIIVGGFFSPSIDHIKAIKPDVIFISDLHQEIKNEFSGTECKVINLKTDSIESGLTSIKLLGKIFNRENQAVEIVEKNRKELALIKNKIAKIPEEKRKRVIRLMGRDKVMTPGSDSFQNDMIRAAGGIFHDFNRNGKVIEVSQEEWARFNPQFIYGCGGDRKTAEAFFNRDGWKNVEAIKNRQIYYFPCDFTCRAATHTGYFVSWLAARMYAGEFAQKNNLAYKENIINSRPLKIDLDYIKDVRIDYSHIYDFQNKTLLIDFKKPVTIVSTLEGQRNSIKTAGNHFAPMPCWSVAHTQSIHALREKVYHILGLRKDNASLLFTGADMDNISVKKNTFRDMTVYALVTAGVKSNAMRMSKDEGGFYEPGTINVIILTNMKLTPRALTRSIISATEGKTAALLDMDIRSSYGNGAYRATGTGTDNVMVVEGAGAEMENAGGHSKLGELIAKTVYAGVIEAVDKQNGLVVKRNIFQRLKERKITTYGLMSKETCDCGMEKSEFAAAVEKCLLDPVYAGFIEASLALSDDYEKGLLKDLNSYSLWAKNIAEEISGKPIDEMKDIVDSDDLPEAIRIAMNALFNGIYYQTKEKQ